MVDCGIPTFGSIEDLEVVHMASVGYVGFAILATNSGPSDWSRASDWSIIKQSLLIRYWYWLFLLLLLIIDDYYHYQTVFEVLLVLIITIDTFQWSSLSFHLHLVVIKPWGFFSRWLVD